MHASSPPLSILSNVTTQFHLPQSVPSTGCLNLFYSSCNKTNFIGGMFYYNYEGLYPGTLRANLHATEALQAPAAQPTMPANPWLAPKPKDEPQPLPGPPTPQHYYKYVPRYSEPVELAPKVSKSVNPWLAPKPQEVNCRPFLECLMFVAMMGPPCSTLQCLTFKTQQLSTVATTSSDQ